MFLFWRTYFRKSYCFYIWEQHIYWNTFQSLTKNLFSCNKTTSFYWSLKHWNCDHHTYIITPHLAVPPTSKSDPGSKNWFMISLWLFGVDRKSIFWRGVYISCDTFLQWTFDIMIQGQQQRSIQFIQTCASPPSSCFIHDENFEHEKIRREGQNAICKCTT